MAAPSSDSEPAPGPTPQEPSGHLGRIPGHALWSGALWSGHSAELAKVAAIDLALFAGHLLLYPTGILPERVPTPPRAPADDTLGTRRATDPPDQGRAHPPVLLLHGFVDNRSAFTLLRRSLLRHGWTRVQALNYSPLTGDIRTAAAMLGPHIERVCAESGHARVDIVGHSLGGLVARYHVQCLGGDARVRTVVTLGTPHSGTRAVPALAPHPLARQMRPGSPVLEELAAPAPGCRTRFAAFWSDLDEFMIPTGSARLEHPDLSVANIRVRGIGHLALPVHGSVAAEVRRALSGAGPLPDAIDAA
ncbi:putative lipase [Actinacidiphila reveromycinica]|uniref:Putative lipase n=1 Tax=Actinacidiphila reveromycinica TaxID=659352 RepID=A0A7U3UVQ8_9ACTN|nr:alpha/beta fold hydrolase [Streptomyces sp. SN-593]BBA99626.1 putative lipase [Streptomyces sp. SN-593]